MLFSSKLLALALASYASAQSCYNASTHTVASGDTLGAIAAANNVTLTQIEAVNQIADPNLIFVGEVIGIPNKDCGTNPTNTTTCVGVSNYTVVSGDTLTKIAAAYNVTLAQIEAANPQITNPNFINLGQVIAIPSPSCVAPASAATPVATANCTTGSSKYTVKSGDTLYIISVAKNITLQSLEDANPQISNFDEIEVGQVINIPICPTSTCVPTPISNYTVKTGDTLYKIAQAYNVTLAALEAVNTQIANFDEISIGQTVYIPSCSPAVTTTSSSATATATCASAAATYTIVSGDTLTKIAAKFGITLASLERANPQITDPDVIYPGEVLNIPGCARFFPSTTPGPTMATPTSAPNPPPTPSCVEGGALNYTVKSGDTLTVIAKAYNVTLQAFIDANPQVTNIDLILIGQVLNVPVCGYVFVLVNTCS